MEKELRKQIERERKSGFYFKFFVITLILLILAIGVYWSYSKLSNDIIPPYLAEKERIAFEMGVRQVAEVQTNNGVFHYLDKDGNLKIVPLVEICKLGVKW